MVSLADIVLGEGAEYLQTHFVRSEQRKALRDIVQCRTEAMGTRAVPCDECSVEYRLFQSCRNRSCPQCQGEARAKWLEARRAEILPVPYSHVVFSVPAELNVLAAWCRELLYESVIRAAGQAIIDVGRSTFRAKLGCQVHLETWGQSMAFHLHAHCVVPCGGFSEDANRWVSFDPADLSGAALAIRFRKLLCKSMRAAMRQGKLDHLPPTIRVEKLLASVMARRDLAYSRPPFGGPEKLLEYLSRYTYRVAITNDRIESYENHRVTFRWRDYRHRNEEKLCTMSGQEFLRRYVSHVPPRGFVRIRSYGFMGNRNRKSNLERARQLIGTGVVPEARALFRPRRLCPTCARRDEHTFHFASQAEGVAQLDLAVRPPPLVTSAA